MILLSLFFFPSFPSHSFHAAVSWNERRHTSDKANQRSCCIFVFFLFSFFFEGEIDSGPLRDQAHKWKCNQSQLWGNNGITIHSVQTSRLSQTQQHSSLGCTGEQQTSTTQCNAVNTIDVRARSAEIKSHRAQSPEQMPTRSCLVAFDHPESDVQTSACVNHLSESCLIWGMPMYLWKCSSTLTTPCSRLATSPYCLFLVMALQHEARTCYCHRKIHNSLHRVRDCAQHRSVQICKSWQPPTLFQIGHRIKKHVYVKQKKKLIKGLVGMFCFHSTRPLIP